MTKRAHNTRSTRTHRNATRSRHLPPPILPAQAAVDGRVTAPLGAALDSDHPLATANYVSLLMGLLRDGRLYDPVADKPFRNLAHFVSTAVTKSPLVAK